MAQESPNSVDVQDIQFKLHSKFTLFGDRGHLRSYVNLLTAASSQGLLFAGNPNAAEFQVIVLKNLVDLKGTGRKLEVRTVPLPNIPISLNCSADGRMLAITYMMGGSGILQIFSVPSFTTPEIKSLYTLRLSPEENVFALQVLWNPVLTNNIAVVLSNGAANMITLEGNSFQLHSLDKSQQIKCGCWSPKGKQIVFGFPNGKLQQFKPDLTPAKMIVCPANVHPGPFHTIAVHWLSTFQFAAVFLQLGEEMAPSLYIVNAPKGGTPSYINYYDICYSATGPRAHQVTFTHIHQWNLLLVTSANGVEVGILGTKETADTPTWVQYNLLDEARIEMPLTDSNDETYPIGFTFDTSSSHQLTIGEQKIPVMPMIHLLSTYGDLVSFNFLNLSPGAADVCSPPPPIMDTSGQFRALEVNKTPSETGEEKAPAMPGTQPSGGDMSFGYPAGGVTASTPAIKDKPVTIFGTTPSTMAASATPPPAPAPTTFGGIPQGGNAFGGATVGKPPAGGITFGKPATTGAQFGTQNVAASGFSGFGGPPAGGSPLFGGFGGKSTEAVAPNVTITAVQQQVTTTDTQKPKEINKPLYTVPPTFVPPASDVTIGQVQQQKSGQQMPPATTPNRQLLDAGEIDEVIKQMTAVQIKAFSTELKHLANLSKNLFVTIGNPDEMKSCTKRLNDLQEIIEQANDRDFEVDVQNLRHSLNESYAMLTECRSKLDMYNNPDISRLANISTFDPINRRQLSKLQSFLATNSAQMQQLQQLIDAQWSCYQDLVRRNTKSQMHIPCLEGIYQRMTKLKELIARQRNKLNHLRTKLKQRGLLYKPANETDSQQQSTIARGEVTMESLADSMLSMSFSHIVDANRSKLSEDKLSAIRNFARQRQKITIIKPQRPDRVGLKSEVILETKLQSERKAREGSAVNLAKMQQEKIPPKTSMGAMSIAADTASHALLPKPTATKPTMAPVQPQTTFAPPAPGQSVGPPTFNFGGTSPFVKTSGNVAVGGGLKLEEASSKPFSIPTTGTSLFNTAAPMFGGFGGNPATSNPAPFTFSQTGKSTAASTKPEPFKDSLGNAPLQTPISFSPKVIGGDSAKAINTLTTPSSGFAALTSNTATTVVSTKPSALAGQKENKKPEETTATSSFSFAPKTDNVVSISAAPSFGGFVATVATTKSSIFDSKPTPAATGGSDFSFANLSASLGASAAAPPNGAAGFNFATAASTAQVSSATPVSTTTVKPPIFGQAQMPSTVPASVASPGPTSGFTFGGSFTAASTAGTPNIFTTPTKAVASSASPTVAVSSKTDTSSSATDPTDSLFGSLNICKPTTKEAAEGANKPTNAGNIFSGFGGGTSTGNTSFSFGSIGGGGGGGDAGKSIFGAASNNSGSFAFGPVAASTLGTSTESFTTSTTVTTTTTSVSVPASTPAPATAAAATFVPTQTAASAPALAPTSVPATAASVSSTTFVAPVPASVAASMSTVAASTAPPEFSSTSVFSVPPSTGVASSAGVTTAGITTTSPFAAVASSAPASGTFAPSPIFGGGTSFLNTSISSAPAATSASTPTATPTPTVAAIPATLPVATSGVSIFATATPAVPIAATTTMPVATSGVSIFGTATAVTTTTTTTTTTATSPFGMVGSVAAATSQPSAVGAGAGAAAGTGLFGGIPKPDQSVFASTASPTSGGGLFASAANASPFGSVGSSGGSIFGGGTATGGSGFGASTGVSGGSSIFGGASGGTSPFGTPAATAVSTGGSIFGGAAAKPAESGNIFGSPTAQSGTAAASGGSIFGQSTFGQSPQSSGNLFAAAAAATPQQQQQQQQQQQSQQPAATGFGTAGSIFGGAASNTAATGGSIFGGGSAFGSSGFGAFSQPATGSAFGSPAATGTFAQAGASVGHSGFGSPTQSPSAFGKPVFGAAPAFGSPPAFGAQPSFGGAPTFGSPKGFGSFSANTGSPPGGGAFTSPTQKSNLFEALGASDSGLSFGNLAQASNTTNAPKPTFGGSSFMNYRS